MKPPPILLLFAVAALACPRGGAAPEPRTTLGDEALAAGLWDVAASHYDERLKDPELGPAERAGLLVKIAETRVRAQQPAEALALLDQSAAKDAPGAEFWRAQAVAGTGRYSEAVELFGKLLENKDSPHRASAAFTRANLLLALDRPEEALATLSQISGEADAPSASEARLRNVAILLDLQRTDEARAMMPEIPEGETALRSFATLLEARLQAAEGHPEAAAVLYQSLLENPTGQTLRRHHLAVLGLADATAALGDPAAAINVLLSFLQKHSDQPLPLLVGFFERIVAWMPEQPAPNDPHIARLTEWVPPFVPPATGLIATDGNGALGAWPGVNKADELAAHSMYAIAIAKSRIGTPEDRAAAYSLLERLRLQFPAHPLAGRALYQEAAMAIEDGDSTRAAAILASLQEFASSPGLRGRAAFLDAVRSYRQGDLAAAREWFTKAAGDLTGDAAASARFNSAVAAFESDGQATLTITQEDAESPALSADLSLERALTREDSAARREAIEAFLGEHPGHPREAEARLAAAEAALAGTEPDVPYAKAQLDTIAENPAALEALPASRIEWVKLRIADLSNDRDMAISLARSMLEREPAPPEAPEAAFLLGRNLFETGDYNNARLVVEKLAASDGNPARAQAAWLLAARSAALVPTLQSQQEALVLFAKAVETDGPVTPVARLEKARLLIDMNRLTEAEEFLRPWFEELPEKDPLHLPAGLLLGEAIGRQGGSSPDTLVRSLAIYDELLSEVGKFTAIFNRLQYERGRALEMLPDPEDPSKTREREAFIAYYSVLETDGPPAEWHYFESCGFKALSLLEKAGRWPAAVACARKIASFHGPRAEEAAKRADDLQLKYMIWED